jgi:hypothetical protein
MLTAPETRAGAAAEAAPEAFSAGSGFAGFSYLMIPGAGLHPRAAATTWSYSGAGCVSAAAGNDLFTAGIDLPHGSRIDYIRLYYYDASPSDSTAYLTRFDGSGGYADLASVKSAAAAGYGHKVSGLIGHVVNNSSGAYVVQWRADQTGPTMRLCGLRIAYRLPVTYTYLPKVLR